MRGLRRWWVPALVLLCCGGFWYPQPEIPPSFIVVDICSRWCGLGNQMFRYAAGLGLAELYPNRTVCIFGLDALQWLAHPHSAFVLHVTPHKQLPLCPPGIAWLPFPWLEYVVNPKGEHMDVFAPPHSTYEPFPYADSGRPVLVNGCMQSFKFFQHLKAPFLELNVQEAAKQWLAQRHLSVVVHVRRGDKVTDGSPVVPVEYYERALALVGTLRVAVCTDDPWWVHSQPVFAHALLSESLDPGFDMALLASATEAVVIGVGTFGWWGAYLSSARRKLFYPTMYTGALATDYVERDYIPYGVPGQGEWIPVP